MARAVIPQTMPPIGPLPFRSGGELYAKGDPVPIATGIPCAVWPASGRNRDVARTYDHEGEAAIQFATELRVANRVLIVDEVRYTVIEAVPQDALPHVALKLREVRSGGGG